MKAGFLALAMVVTIFTPSLSAADDPDASVRYPVVPPIRERTFVSDDHSAWTLRRGESAVPLAVVSTPGRTAISLAGGWIVLGADLEFLPSSLDFLASGQSQGTPWAQAAGSTVVFVAGSPGDLVVLYPETAVSIRRRIDVTELSHFAVTDQGFLFVQSRRASGCTDWNRSIREVQPLPFFPSDLTSASDGTAWAADSLQARPWRQEEGFWKPLDFPKAPGRLTTLAPFPDSTGYFAGGPGWVGAFSSDGTPFWVRDKDLGGQALPRDLKIRSGAGRLYLWSAQARKVWCWGWNPEGPAGRAGAPSAEQLVQAVGTEIQRLEALGSVPEAQSVAQYGTELADSVLKLQPFSALWAQAFKDFESKRQALRTRGIGAGVFVVTWEAPFGRPLASWSWEPDAGLSDVKAWRLTMKPYWEGRALESDEFKIGATGDRAPWPGAEDYLQGPLRLPSWMSLEFRPEGSEEVAHWTRVLLPSPVVPYELPVE